MLDVRYHASPFMRRSESDENVTAPQQGPYQMDMDTTKTLLGCTVGMARATVAITSPYTTARVVHSSATSRSHVRLLESVSTRAATLTGRYQQIHGCCYWQWKQQPDCHFIGRSARGGLLSTCVERERS
jgi:hypothetical protein